MDFRADPPPPFARPAGSLPLVVRTADERPIPLAPPFGQGRRLPSAPRQERSGDPRRSSERRCRSIAEVNAVLSTPSAPPTGRDPSRWARLEALVLEAGVPRARLLEAFPTVEDIEDIFHTADADLSACAATLVRALGAVGEPIAATVRCADCRHFLRASTHPRLGRCGVGQGATAAAGWWDTQSRTCGSFAASEPVPPGAVGTGTSAESVRVAAPKPLSDPM